MVNRLYQRERNHGAVSRARSPATAFARCAGVAASGRSRRGVRGGTLDAGRDNAPDACASRDAASPGCPPTGLLDNLVGHWRLDDGTGSTVAFDSSGRGNNGALHGLDASTAWVAGRSQGALNMAHAGWVQVAPSPSIDAIVDRVTVGAWINLEGTITAADKFGTALSRQIGTSEDQYYHLSLLLGRPTLFITTGNGYVMPSAPDAVPRDTWIHLAGVYDGAVARLYVNGAEVASEPMTGSFAPRHDARHPGWQRQRRERHPDRAVPGPHRRDDVVCPRAERRGDWPSSPPARCSPAAPGTPAPTEPRARSMSAPNRAGAFLDFAHEPEGGIDDGPAELGGAEDAGGRQRRVGRSESWPTVSSIPKNRFR